MGNMATIPIPSTPAPKLKALTPTTDPNQAYAELGPQYTNEMNAIGQESNQLDTNFNTTMADLGTTRSQTMSSLDQAKSNAFTSYGNTANSRGLFFSGFQPYEQNNYMQTKYNPGVTDANTKYTEGVNSANATLNAGKQSLQDKIAQLNQQRADEAQQLVLNTQAQQAADAKANAAAAKAAGPTEAQQKQAFSDASLANMQRLAGSDGHISPETYAQEAIKWLNAGYSVSDLKSLVDSAGLLNKSNGYYNYALSQAIKRSQ